MRLGIRVIDEDHEHLLCLVAEVEELIRVHAGLGELRPKFHELVEYALAHFRREEEFMRRCGYPGTAGHAREHGELGEWLGHMEEGLAEEGPTATAATRQDVVTFFHAWVQRHLEMLDRPAARYILDHSGHDLPPCAEHESSFPCAVAHQGCGACHRARQPDVVVMDA